MYLILLITLTFFYPERERFVKTYEYHFIPLQSTIAQIKDPAQYDTPGYWRIFFTGIAGNFLLFFPLGFFLKFFTRRSNRVVLLYTVLASIAIELSQLVFHLGVCDIDDVILNSAGGFAGIMFCCMIYRNLKESNTSVNS